MFWTKWLHVMFAVMLLGSVIASFFYVSSTEGASDDVRLPVLKKSIKIDYFVFLPLILFEMITGTMMVHYRQYLFSTPWIVTAYVVMTGVFFLVLLCAQKKKNNKGFAMINAMMIILLCLVIHDAVMKQTMIEHFIR